MKQFLLVCIIATGCMNLHAQAPAIEWQNTIGGTLDENLYSIEQTADGGYLLGGQSYSGITGDKTEANIGNVDYWVVKLNATGAIEWQNTIGGTNSDNLYVAHQTTDGGYILGGTSKSGISGDKTENHKGPADYWIVKLDASGNVVWDNTIGGNLSDYLMDLIQTPDGGYLAGGYSDSPMSADKTETSLGGFDYWVVKLDATGNITWQNTIGGSLADNLFCLSNSGDGGYILGGYSASGITGDKTEASMGSYDAWVIKLNATGNIVWQSAFGGSSEDGAYMIKQTPDGGYIAACGSNSAASADKSENSKGLNDYWIVKLNSTGNIEWENTIGGSATDNIYAVDFDDSGYYFAGESSSGISGDKTEANLGLTDEWIIHTDGSGNILWQNTIGGTASDSYNFSDLDVTSDGGLILGGFSNSGITGDKTENDIGGFDYWVIKLFPGPDLCNAPIWIYSDNITSTSATLHWNAVTGATKYQINYRPVAGGSWLKKNSLMTSKNLTGLTPNTTYEYKIKTVCDAGASSFSPLFNFTTLPLRAGQEEAGFNIYPNPANDFIIVETGELNRNNAILNLIDIRGNLIAQYHVTSDETNINIADLPVGIYLIQSISGNEMNAQKFIKE